MTLKQQSREDTGHEDTLETTQLTPPEGLSPLEQALWTLTVFSQQVAAFTEDATRGLQVAAMNQLEQPPLPKLTRRMRSPRRRPGGLRQAG